MFKQVDNNLLLIFTLDPLRNFVKQYFNGVVEMNEDNLNQMIQISWGAITVSERRSYLCIVKLNSTILFFA
ncbi:hypothetical protein [Paenibacillus antarcticus]|uniref:hypothetical protein n=1 Tax=Paenibacillus antarcticus TaxID=253703 RepID=UPI003B84A790